MAHSNISIDALHHPEFTQNETDWFKWRLAYGGGSDFINEYLQKFSVREDIFDFQIRKKVSYSPSFAKAGIDEIKNSIFQRMIDISRVGGTPSYQEAITGINGGVDLEANTMDSFIGTQVLPELLTMGKVGVFVDMPPVLAPQTLLSEVGQPYLYIYHVEDIRSWVMERKSGIVDFQRVLLRDHTFVHDHVTGLPIGVEDRFRNIWISPETGLVNVQLFTKVDAGHGNFEFVGGEVIELKLTKIPFVLFEITDSLMKDVADYQIALLNLASSDIGYALKSNFPFYTEQFDPRAEASPYFRAPGEPQFDADGHEIKANPSGDAEKKDIKVGVNAGRQYPINTERPGFIHPSSEPMKVSMEKQQQLKSEIRLLLHLALANMRTTNSASAESKKVDDRSLESGLSAIGEALERGERQVTEIWSMYEGEKDVAEVKYPKNYSLRSEQERRAEAKDLAGLQTTVASPTYQKEVSKKISKIMLGCDVSKETLDKIDTEIDSAINLTADPDVVAKDVENQLVDPETASKLRGYPEGVAKKAEEAHSRRLARISEAQSKDNLQNPAARGVPDADDNPKSGEEEKAASRDNTENGDVVDRTRGEGKSNG